MSLGCRQTSMMVVARHTDFEWQVTSTGKVRQQNLFKPFSRNTHLLHTGNTTRVASLSHVGVNHNCRPQCATHIQKYRGSLLLQKHLQSKQHHSPSRETAFRTRRNIFTWGSMPTRGVPGNKVRRSLYPTTRRYGCIILLPLLRAGDNVIKPWSWFFGTKVAPISQNDPKPRLHWQLINLGGIEHFNPFVLGKCTSSSPQPNLALPPSTNHSDRATRLGSPRVALHPPAVFGHLRFTHVLKQASGVKSLHTI